MDRVRKGAGEGDISRRGVRVTARANKVDLAKIDKKGHVFFFFRVGRWKRIMRKSLDKARFVIGYLTLGYCG